MKQDRLFCSFGEDLTLEPPTKAIKYELKSYQGPLASVHLHADLLRPCSVQGYRVNRNMIRSIEQVIPLTVEWADEISGDEFH